MAEGSEKSPSTAPLDRLIERGLLRTNTELGENRANLLELAATVLALVDLLVEKGLLDGAEVRARVERARAEVEADESSRVTRARVQTDTGDKHAADNAEVDCGARFALCRGACCSMQVPLSTQDVEEGMVRWDLGRPYFILHGDDGRCVHQDRATHFCGLYEERPLACRTYSCRGDRRIWKDFDARLPNEKGIAALLAQKFAPPLVLIGHRPTIALAPTGKGDPER
ncbi:MAG: YkgJ family cysteine cluster protein [Myxococcales bacterium]|nr:YkgJ family cysteine cluster protein [Myxococcales bacterium]